MGSSKLLLLLCLSLVAAMPIGAIKLPPNVTVPAVIGFGDSIIDPGNNNHLKSVIICDFPPYGTDFVGEIPTGRFSNGKIPTDLLAEELSVKSYVPAYVDVLLTPEELLTGVSFASGGAGYDPMTAKLASVISLSEQLDYFKEYIGKVTHLVGKEKTEFILNNAIFLVVAGSDDIANTYFDLPFRRKQYDINSYTDLMLHFASSFIKDLYNLGARRIGVFSAPPIGCVPSQRTLAGGIVRECAKDYNRAAQLFNSKLARELDSLNRKLSNSRVVYIDIYNPLLELIQNGDNYGFEEVTKGCCGTGALEVAVLCNKLDVVCPDRTKYLFFDSYHPTEKGYQLLINKLITIYIGRLV